MNPALRPSSKQVTLGQPAPRADEAATEDAEDSEAIEEVEAEARHWVVLLHTDPGAAQRHTEFVRWRDGHPSHAAAMRQAQDWWRQCGHVPAQAVGSPLRPAAHTYSYQPPTSSFMGPPTELEVEALVHTRSGRPALVAALVLAVTALLWWSVDRSDHSTGLGESRILRLADGSSLQLDTDTALDVDIGVTERRVTLGRGEVFIEVAPDASRPFVVDAGIGQVRAQGTAFAVRREDGSVSVTVERGAVEVGGPALARPLQLQAGQRIRFDRVGHSDVHPVKLEDALAWRNGRLQFHEQPLVAVLAEIRRYDPRIWLVPDGAVAQARLSTSVAFEQVDAWLDALPETLPVTVLRFGPLVWVRERDATAPR